MLRCLTIKIVGVVTVIEAEVAAEFVEVAVHVPDSVHVSRAVSLSLSPSRVRACVFVFCLSHGCLSGWVIGVWCNTGALMRNEMATFCKSCRHTDSKRQRPRGPWDGSVATTHSQLHTARCRQNLSECCMSSGSDSSGCRRPLHHMPNP